ncbi:MAG: FISUMP domain-containing protein, partial [Bacteroidota bacterium]
FLFLILSLFSFLFQKERAFAVSAYPHPAQYTQPDGSRINILLHGDEFIHWATTVDGYTILNNSTGFYEYAILNQTGDLGFSGEQAKNPELRTMSEKAWLQQIQPNLFFSKSQITAMRNAIKSGTGGQPPTPMTGGFPNTGTRKLLMILANFSNTTTTYTQSNFNNLMNQANYNGIGSFRDFYLEVSYGQLTVNTTVTVWVTLPQTHDYYGPDTKWGDFAYDAVVAANVQAGVDYSQFDNDNNGVVDGVTIIHQGRGQEESGNINDIWSHSWDLASAGYTLAQRTFDGVEVYSYTANPEKFGTVNMTNIGVLCHEFCHNLGAPDFYDTDYGTNGQYNGTGYWDLMANGSWNGSNGNKPAHPNGWIKSSFAWTNPTVLSTQQTVVLRNSQLYADAVRYNTTTANEYFLCENRQQTGFDGAIPGHGMLIYHVDGDYISLHSDPNDINTGSHQGMYPMSAISTTSNGIMLSGSSNINTGGCPWPGTGNKTTFTDATTPNSLSWAGANTNKPLLTIAENTTTKEISFCFISCLPIGTLPTVTTNNVTDILATTATSGGNVTSDGGLIVSERGVCWSTLTNPTITDSHTTDGMGTGLFVSSINGLTLGTIYHVRAYATNSLGTSYGNEVTFISIPSCPGTPTISYGGQTYNTIQIGNQCWLRENLNIGTRINGSLNQTNNSILEKYCYNDLESNCDIYGGLYQWDEVMQYVYTEGVQGICPSDWHLPDDIDWNILLQNVGAAGLAGGSLKEAGTIHWASPNTGATNSSGFTALPPGARTNTGTFIAITLSTNIWSSSVWNPPDASSIFLQYSRPTFDVYSNERSNGFSGRCLKNCPLPSSPSTGLHIPTTTQILWNWNSLPGALGFKWNTVNNYTTASDLGIVISRAEAGLNCGTAFTRYVWAYNACGHTPVTILTQSTLPCPTAACGQPVTDNRDGKTYNTVQIGNQCWFRENLNIGSRIDGSQDQLNNGIIEKYCNYDLETKCDTYGGLYQWNELMQYSGQLGTQGICPSGWHVPTWDEWQWLTYLLLDSAGARMKTTGTIEGGNGLWYAPNTGATNTSGFNALPGGWKDEAGNFTNQGYMAAFFTSQGWWDCCAEFRTLYYNDISLSGNHTYKSNSLSVRCLKNAATMSTVTTSTISGITATTAVGGGNVTNDGGADVTARGVVWGTAPNPTVTSYVGITTNGTGMGMFTSNLNGLAPGTTYYVRAYATNSMGTAYGVAVEFMTMPTILAVSGLTINAGTDTCFNATQTINVSNFTVKSGGSAIFVSGVNILLQPATEVENGG